MSKSFIPAVIAVFALALAGTPAALSAAEPKGPSVSPGIAKAMKEVQDAAGAKRFADVISRANAVLATPSKTPYDTYVAYQFLTYAYAQQGNRAELLKAMQGQIDSGHPQGAEQTKLINDMSRVAYESKDYATVVELGNRLIRSGAADAGTYGLVGHSMFSQGKFADASKFLGEHVADQERRGQTPREQTLNTLFSAQEKAGNRAGVTDTLERLVVHYPKPDYWNLLLYSLSRDPKLTERQTLQVYRLKLATQTLKRCADFTEMADIAVNGGMPGEGQKVIELGLASKVCTEKTDQDRLQRLLAAAGRAMAEDKAEMGKLESEARSSKTGELDVVLGSSLFGYGDFPKAVDALARGTSKGGLKNLTDAQLTLGIAQIRAGNKPEAIKTFRAIKTEDVLYQRIVKLWVLYAQ